MDIYNNKIIKNCFITDIKPFSSRLKSQNN